MTADLVEFYRSNTAKEGYLHNSINLILTEVFDIMKECYGPYGSHILITNNGKIDATKDGKAILSSIRTNAGIPNAILKSIVNVANKQVAEVGDGSTTTILLLCELYKSFRQIIKENNLSPSAFVDICTEVVSDIKKSLNIYSTPVVIDGAINYEKLNDAIFTSADGNVELSNTIINMFRELGTINPYILIDTSTTDSSYYKLVKGVEMEGTIIRPDIYFGGYSSQKYDTPDVILIDGQFKLPLDKYMDLAHECIRNETDIIFMAIGIEENLLEQIININNINPGTFNRVPIFQIRRTSDDEEFMDICAALGTSPLDEMRLKGVIDMNTLHRYLSNAGHCDGVVLGDRVARFNNPHSDNDRIKERIDDIDMKIKALEEDPAAYNNTIGALEARKAFLTKNHARLYVGGSSPQRKMINYELANDAIPQAISCMKHGIVNGCNTVVRDIIDSITETSGSQTKEYLSVLLAIQSAYAKLTHIIIANKYGDNIPILKTLNIRDNCTYQVCNSADTDRAILDNAVDMASLLATSKAYISMNTEYDVVNKGYNI